MSAGEGWRGPLAEPERVLMAAAGEMLVWEDEPVRRPDNLTRVVSTFGALYGKPQRASKRRRCDGHLTDRHWIESGDLYIWSSLPPNHPDIGNIGWWHHAYCSNCWPESINQQVSEAER